jgi:hypothetical protein
MKRKLRTILKINPRRIIPQNRELQPPQLLPLRRSQRLPRENRLILPIILRSPNIVPHAIKHAIDGFHLHRKIPKPIVRPRRLRPTLKIRRRLQRQQTSGAASHPRPIITASRPFTENLYIRRRLRQTTIHPSKPHQESCQFPPHIETYFGAIMRAHAPKRNLSNFSGKK